MFRKSYKLKTNLKLEEWIVKELEGSLRTVDITLERAGNFNSSYIYQVTFYGDEDHYDAIRGFLEEHNTRASTYKEAGVRIKYICPVKLVCEDESYFDEIFTLLWKSLEEKTINGVEMMDLKYEVAEECLEISLTARDTENQHKINRTSAIAIGFVMNYLFSESTFSFCLEHHKLNLLKLVESSIEYKDMENYVIMPIQTTDLLCTVILVYGKDYDHKDFLRIAKEAAVSDKIRDLLRRISVLGRIIEYKGLINQGLSRECNK